MSAFAGDASRVYVYSQRLTDARSWLPVSCDGAVVAEIRRGYFFALEVAPGLHTLIVADGVPVPVRVASGEEKYVRLDWPRQAGRPAIPVLSAVPRDRARSEMKFLSYVEPGRIRAASVARSDPRQPEEQQLKRRREAER